MMEIGSPLMSGGNVQQPTTILSCNSGTCKSGYTCQPSPLNLVLGDMPQGTYSSENYVCIPENSNNVQQPTVNNSGGTTQFTAAIFNFNPFL
ncbi:MAG: hypothetical protein ACYDDA_05870 [Acidiferrobacteraceae bacterium]